MSGNLSPPNPATLHAGSASETSVASLAPLKICGHLLCASVFIHTVLQRRSRLERQVQLHTSHSYDGQTESSAPRDVSVLGVKQTPQSQAGIPAPPPHLPVTSSVKLGLMFL